MQPPHTEMDSTSSASISHQPDLKLEVPSTPQSRPTRLLLICHAESMQRRYGDWALSDTGLTATGWEQASALGEWLRTHEAVEHLVSSDQLRSRLTAQRISQALGIGMALMPSLPTSPRRDWTLHPPQHHDRQSAEEASDYHTYAHQLLTAINQILEDRWAHTTALVSDSAAIATLIRHVCGGHQMGIAIDDTSISELVLADGQWQLAYANRREHLPRPPLTSASMRSQPQIDVDLQEQLTQIRHIYNRLATTRRENEGVDETAYDEQDNTEFLRFAHVQEGQRLLEVGSGTGDLTLTLARTGAREVIGVDISPAMLERAEYRRLNVDDQDLMRRVNYRLAPAHALPFANETFDVLLCRQVLHHLPKLDRTLREFHRVLKPGGALVLAEIAGSEDAVKRATQNAIEAKRNPSHATIRTVEQYRTQLNTAGFVVEAEELVTRERKAQEWLDALAVEKGTQQAVLEMLEASIETDAAELHVRQQDDQLIFDQTIVYLRARKPEG